MSRRILLIGECMVELSQGEGGLLRQGFAGDTFNTAWHARACLPASWSVDYFTALGDDPLSDAMAAFIDAAGIGTGGIARIAGGAPGLYLISLKNGERSFTYWRDASAARRLAADAGRLREATSAADVLYFSGITLAILPEEDAGRLIVEARRAKAVGKLVAFDPNIRPRLWASAERMRALIGEAAAAATLVMPSFDDEAAHFGDHSPGDTIHRYRALGADGVLVKNGADGAAFSIDGRDASVPAEPVADVVDTTGAGDSFNGAFLARYLTSNDALEAARFAARVAAHVITRHGALVPLADELRQPPAPMPPD